ncbi:MAG: hypothetical protein MZV70_06195 [Desulfobacterales bacterium]|nr:hypothetical protein [Desulfobacterales bacterium]
MGRCGRGGDRPPRAGARRSTRTATWCSARPSGRPPRPLRMRIGVRPQFDAAAELSERVISVALMARDKIAHANTDKYVGGPEPGINRAMPTASSARPRSSLSIARVGQKAAGYMADISFRTVMAIVEALADGSLYTTDTARAEALVVSPDNASLFWKCVVAEAVHPRESATSPGEAG